jgi:hypothetical protein
VIEAVPSKPKPETVAVTQGENGVTRVKCINAGEYSLKGLAGNWRSYKSGSLFAGSPRARVGRERPTQGAMVPTPAERTDRYFGYMRCAGAFAGPDAASAGDSV